jgi:hypothetical protein
MAEGASLIATGCSSMMYADALEHQVPVVDGAGRTGRNAGEWFGSVHGG